MSQTASPHRIIGLDPGIGRTGYAVIEEAGTEWRALAYGCFETEPNAPLPGRLADLAKQLQDVLQTYRPAAASVEVLFFSKNVKTAMAVGQARGVALLAFAQHGLPVYEFTPNEVKCAVTGYGNADKRQMQDMVRLQFSLKEIPKPDDVADALAIALCCAASVRAV